MLMCEPTLFFFVFYIPRSSPLLQKPTITHTTTSQRDHREANSDTSGLRGGQITPSSGEEENQDWLVAIAYAEIETWT